MNWGKSIVLSFVFFAVFIGLLVAVCVRQDIDLVSKNYYAEELEYQQQIERISNTAQLTQRPTVHVVNGMIEVKFDQPGEIGDGKLMLFRPSDERMDKQFDMWGEGGIQRFDVRSLPGGMYRLKMRWTMSGREYYIEDVITL